MAELKFRIEKDSIGEKEIPVDAYYGINAIRGAENFNITGRKIHKELIIGLAEVKKACAISNFEAGIMTEEVKDHNVLPLQPLRLVLSFDTLIISRYRYIVKRYF